MDLIAIVTNLAKRNSSRSEATIQADVRNLLLVGPFDLVEGNLEEVVLESQVGDRKRIDIELGRAVIEVKKDLRKGKVLADAQGQLAGYVEARQKESGFRYVGLLTDGRDWYCFHLINSKLVEVSSFFVKSPKNDVERLTLWIDGVLATAKSIPPVPKEVERRLGHDSSSHKLDRVTLRSLYLENKDLPSIQIKRDLWARLLFTALGTQFSNDDDLFIEHTLLVNSAEIIAHAVLGLPVDQIEPSDLLTGTKFSDSGIYGVVESDFFDWVIELDEGIHFIRTLAHRLERFEWSSARHDILKILYESIILPETRRKLGEYYTPDWLAEVAVRESIIKPLDQKVLDPSCGSGTFLFHAVKKYLEEAEKNKIPVKDAIAGVAQKVMGIDLHPVAVALARVTYLLAIGKDRITDPTRGAIQIPVYLGDSIQMKNHETDLWSSGYLVIQVDKGKEFYSSQLKFPDSLLTDSKMFDDLVTQMTVKASNREKDADIPNLEGIYKRLCVPLESKETLNETFKFMCKLHDEGKNHIWGYFIRNLARPMWLSRSENRVDTLIGNPPWLPYRSMTSEMQKIFKAMSEERHLWEGSKVATHQDLSSFFVARTTQLYLKNKGRLAFVMPNSIIDRAQFIGFRTGHYPDPTEPIHINFSRAWDLRRIRPHFFPRGSAVIFGERTDVSSALPKQVKKWSGTIPKSASTWKEVAPHLNVQDYEVDIINFSESPYKKQFANGATIVPRVLFMINRKPAGPLGMPHGHVILQSSTSSTEKEPWKSIPRLEGVVESQFIFQIYLSENILPYRPTPPRECVMPVLDGVLITDHGEDLSLHPGLEKWWKKSSELWTSNRKSHRLNLLEQMDYRNKLSNQIPIQEKRVVYTKSGMHLAAARISNPNSFIDHSLYWCSVSCDDEAHFLCSIFNSAKFTELARPLMAYGKDERHFDKHLLNLPIPHYDPDKELHKELSRLGRILEKKISFIEVDPKRYFPATRSDIRGFLSSDEDGSAVEDIVGELLA